METTHLIALAGGKHGNWFDQWTGGWAGSIHTSQGSQMFGTVLLIVLVALVVGLVGKRLFS